jgi:zinc protease
MAGAAPASSSASSSSPLVLLLDRPGLAQATVLLGEPGVSIADPDAPAVDVLSTALNSFGGALFDAVRSRDGLAYSVAASWGTPSDHRGIFLASADTSRPAELLAELHSAMQRAGGVSAEAVSRAQQQSLEQFAFSLGRSTARMARALSFDVLGLPAGLCAAVPRSARRGVTQRGVAAAAGRWLHASDASGEVVVAGDALVVRAELEASGFLLARRQVRDAPPDVRRQGQERRRDRRRLRRRDLPQMLPRIGVPGRR